MLHCASVFRSRNYLGRKASDCHGESVYSPWYVCLTVGRPQRDSTPVMSADWSGIGPGRIADPCGCNSTHSVSFTTSHQPCVSGWVRRRMPSNVLSIFSKARWGHVRHGKRIDHTGMLVQSIIRPSVQNLPDGLRLPPVCRRKQKQMYRIEQH